jgi:hypothetical protein
VKISTIIFITKYSEALWVSFVAGALSDVTSNVMISPVEVIVQRIYIQDQSKKQYKNSFGMIT